MAKPQEDEYDTRILEILAAEKYQFKKVSVTEGKPSMFDGAVPLTHLKQKAAPYLDHAAFDHPSIPEAEDLLKKVWPEMATQCAALLTEVAIMSDTRNADRAEMCGCTCGNTAGFGGICCTVEGAIGLCHGLVHELGHWKLHAMGVHLEHWDNLISNSEDEMFESPIRKDKPRPMGACLQAQYSYLHVLEFEVRTAKTGRVSDMLSLNSSRMTAGRETLKSWKPDENGVAFAAALDAWTGALLAEAAPFV